MAGPWEKYGQGGVQVKPADPKLPGEVARTGLLNQQTQQQMGLDAQAAARQAEAESRQRTQMIADLYDKGLRPKAGGGVEPIPGWKPVPTEAKPDMQAQQRIANIRAAYNRLRDVANLFQKGPGATSGLAGLADYLPLDSNAEFDTAGKGLGETAFAAFRVPGSGTQSDADLRNFIDANTPSSWDRDVQVRQKLGNIENRLSETYKAMGLPYRPILSSALRKPASKADDGWKIEEVK